jgi:di/tricarboxylate transporter
MSENYKIEFYGHRKLNPFLRRLYIVCGVIALTVGLFGLFNVDPGSHIVRELWAKTIYGRFSAVGFLAIILNIITRPAHSGGGCTQRRCSLKSTVRYSNGELFMPLPVGRW